jgi:hypothetical protein
VWWTITSRSAITKASAFTAWWTIAKHGTLPAGTVALSFRVTGGGEFPFAEPRALTARIPIVALSRTPCRRSIFRAGRAWRAFRFTRSPGSQCGFADVTRAGLEELSVRNNFRGIHNGAAGFAQGGHFLLRQRAEFAWFNIQRESTVPRALDFLHMMANLLKHAADLAVLTLRKRYFIPGIVRYANQAYLCGRGAYGAKVLCSRLAADTDSSTQLFDIFFLRQPTNFNQISLGNVGGGFGKKVCQFAIIGHKQQAFTGVIKTADGVDALAHVLDQTHYRGAAFGIGYGGHIALRLVEQQVDVIFRAVQQLAIDLDVIGGEIGFGAELGNNLSIDGDAALCNQLFGFAAGSDPCGGNNFL